jgi:hypothetical protein
MKESCCICWKEESKEERNKYRKKEKERKKEMKNNRRKQRFQYLFLFGERTENRTSLAFIFTCSVSIVFFAR